MDQSFNNGQNQTNRFIFSDDFYDNLDNTDSKKEDSVVDINIPSIDIKQEEAKDDLVPIFNVSSTIEEVKDEEPISINNSVVLENKPDLGISTYQDDRQIDLVSTNMDFDYSKENNSNQFNVESGIDTKLEQELMKAKIQEEYKAPIVENNVWLKEEPKKEFYRAIRNTVSTPPVWEQVVVDNQNNNINNIPEVREVDDIKYVPTPDVINIDQELLKEDPEDMEIIFGKDNLDNNSNVEVVKSDLLVKLREKERETGKISILARYGEDFCSRDYVTNPAIGRDEEIKKLNLILLTPEKSGILVGKPGIGKTSIVEGLAYQLQRGNVPDRLKGYCIISVKTTSLIGLLPNGETRLQTLIDELADLDKIILFIDEIHMLMDATNESGLDFANMFKESLGRGNIKMIGATTNDEYERYILRDKAFVRRFERIDVEEPDRDETIKILMGTIPKIEKNTGAKLKYSRYVQSEIMAFIVDITSEYKRVYGVGSRYPDICLTLLSQAFSHAIFDNRNEVDINDIRDAISNSKSIYPDVIRKELINFDNKFNQIIKD